MKKLIIILALVGALSLVSIASAQFSSLQTWGSFGSDAGQFYGMSGIATDTSGNVYVAELDNRVQKFSGNGEYLTEFNIPARDIAIDSAGNIYTVPVCQTHGHFGRFWRAVRHLCHPHSGAGALSHRQRSGASGK